MLASALDFVAEPTSDAQRWSLDFATEHTSDGQRFRVLTIDDFSRRSPGAVVEVQRSTSEVQTPARRVLVVLKVPLLPPTTPAERG